jgi:hypothetical protein
LAIYDYLSELEAEGLLRFEEATGPVDGHPRFEL